MKRRDEYGLPHDLQTSVCRSGKKGRLRCGGGGRARKKRSSSLLPRDSVCCSAGQSILSLSTARVTTSSSSSYCRDWGGSSTLTVSSSSEEEWSSVEPAPRKKLLSLTASSPGAGARSGGSGRRQGLACLHFLLQIELWAPRVQTPLCLGSSGTWTAGLTRENPVHKQGFSGAERTQRQALTIRQSASSLNAAAACSAPKQATHCLCVSPAVMKRLQGDTHGLNKRDLPSPL